MKTTTNNVGARVAITLNSTLNLLIAAVTLLMVSCVAPPPQEQVEYRYRGGAQSRDGYYNPYPGGGGQRIGSYTAHRMKFNHTTKKWEPINGVDTWKVAANDPRALRAMASPNQLDPQSVTLKAKGPEDPTYPEANGRPWEQAGPPKAPGR